VELIRQYKQRMGVENVTELQKDSSVFDGEYEEKFDAVLCDVPCSGLGIIRRKPDIKYKKADDFSELEGIQFDILQNAANYVKKGGRLLYSTCTLRKAENEEIVNKFLNQNKEFILEYIHTFLPHVDGTDGFFTALIKKR
jgi:16S rRNA (cytosine967-C5)-methyltransferase